MVSSVSRMWSITARKDITAKSGPRGRGSVECTAIVTEAERDADSVSRVYARLSEKFKALWMFHQFLQGVHRTSLKGAPVPEVAFAPLYEQIKRIKETKGVEPEDATKAAMRRLDGELDGLHEALADD